jgi:hypothetical protein
MTVKFYVTVTPNFRVRVLKSKLLRRLFRRKEELGGG